MSDRSGWQHGYDVFRYFYYFIHYLVLIIFISPIPSLFLYYFRTLFCVTCSNCFCPFCCPIFPREILKNTNDLRVCKRMFLPRKSFWAFFSCKMTKSQAWQLVVVFSKRKKKLILLSGFISCATDPFGSIIYWFYSLGYSLAHNLERARGSCVDKAYQLLYFILLLWSCIGPGWSLLARTCLTTSAPML